MKKLNQYPVTDYNKFPQNYYFLSIVKEIIKIANLDKSKKIILDYGCGKKIFSKYLPDKKILNYDINPLFSEIKNYKNHYFDLVIFNHVLMYLTPTRINELLVEIKKKNPKCKIILSLSKQNLISKIAMILSFNFKAHEKTKSSYFEQIEQLNNKTKIIRKKLGVFGITDIFYCEFK